MYGERERERDNPVSIYIPVDLVCSFILFILFYFIFTQ